MGVGKPLLLGTLCLAVAAPAEATTPLNRAQTEQYRQVGGRFGLTPEQVAQVFAFIDSQLAIIDAAAREEQVNVTAFRAIARELGLRAYGAEPGKLIEAIRKQARDVAKFEADNVTLRRQIAALQDVRVRAPAEATLARADAAYKAGDLDAAQAALEELIALRAGELAGTGAAWESATQAAISLAATRGDLDRLDRLVDEAEASRQRRAEQQREAGRHATWENRMTQAGAYVTRSVSSTRFVQGRVQGDSDALLRAITICREKALPLAPRDVSPEDWAETQSFLGISLRMLGELESGTARLREALPFYRASSEVQTRERDPVQWAAGQDALGDVLRLIGERERGTAELRDAVEAHRAALEGYTRANAPKALTLHMLGYALNALSQRESELGENESGMARLKETVDVYRALLEEQSRAREPLEWAKAQDDLGLALMRLGVWEDGTGRLTEAASAFRLALEEQTGEQARSDWAHTQTHLGDALHLLGVIENRTERLVEAISAYRAALRALGRGEGGTAFPGRAIDVLKAAVKDERVSIDWGQTQIKLAGALASLADRTGNEATLVEAWHLVGEAGAFVRQANPPLVVLSDNVASGIKEIALRHAWRLPAADGLAP